MSELTILYLNTERRYRAQVGLAPNWGLGMRNRFAAMAVSAMTFALTLGAAAQANADIVNISASATSPTTYNFTAGGEYLISFAGIAGGGLYDDYNLGCSDGCPASGWSDSFFYTVLTGAPNPDIDGISLSGGSQFSSSSASLAAFQGGTLIDTLFSFVPTPTPGHYQNQPNPDFISQPWLVNVPGPISVNFSIADPLGTRGDDVGGVSLSITAVPEPSAWALMIVGFAGLGVLLRQRRRERALTAA